MTDSIKCQVHGYTRHADCPGCPDDAPPAQTSKQRCMVIPIATEREERQGCELLRQAGVKYWVADLPIERVGPIMRLAIRPVETTAQRWGDCDCGKPKTFEEYQLKENHLAGCKALRGESPVETNGNIIELIDTFGAAMTDCGLADRASPGYDDIALAADRARDALIEAVGAGSPEPTGLTEAEQLLKAWADPLPPNGRLYWTHVELAREYFKRRSSLQAAERCAVCDHIEALHDQATTASHPFTPVQSETAETFRQGIDRIRKELRAVPDETLDRSKPESQL